MQRRSGTVLGCSRTLADPRDSRRLENGYNTDKSDECCRVFHSAVTSVESGYATAYLCSITCCVLRFADTIRHTEP